MSSSATVYNQKYFDLQVIGANQSAATLLPLVKEIVRPKSVLDVGCGNGAWLGVWCKLGVKDIAGVDGAYINKSKLPFPSSNFIEHDLKKPLILQRKFDLVMSLEVAEHIEEEFAEQFVESLVAHGEVVFFSAAIPGQGGTHHVNERWPSYWAHFFAKHGYKAYDILRPKFWNMKKIEVWYRQNCLIFASDDAAKVLKLKSVNTPLDVVHPELFTDQINGLKSLEAKLAAKDAENQMVKVSLKQFLKSSPIGPALISVNTKRKRFQKH